MTRTIRFGGSFAPPITEADLDKYAELAKTAEPKVKEAVTALITMLRKFWETPESKQSGSPHPSGRGVIVPLEDAEIKRIWDFVPWEEELDTYAKWFEKLNSPAQKKLRDAAFHLLWYGRELCADREPITADKL